MQININSKEYWNSRFETGDWEDKNGRRQTTLFAYEQMKKLKIPKSFSGTLLDFGCGLGDAIPVYHSFLPKANLIGIDHSEVAIKMCIEKYGSYANFLSVGLDDIPSVDIIISSNVFEHLSNYEMIAKELILKCNKLIIVVPYNEDLRPDINTEHINSFNEKSFAHFNVEQRIIYKTRGMGYSTFVSEIWHVLIKNIIKQILFIKPLKYNPPNQILFSLQGAL
jgi:hypothetical protein